MVDWNCASKSLGRGREVENTRYNGVQSYRIQAKHVAVEGGSVEIEVDFGADWGKTTENIVLNVGRKKTYTDPDNGDWYVYVASITGEGLWATTVLSVCYYGNPYAQITNLIHPTSAKVGTEFDCTPSVCNTGNLGGSFDIKYYEGGTLIKTVQHGRMDAGVCLQNLSGRLTMPDHDLIVTVKMCLRGTSICYDERTVTILLETVVVGDGFTINVATGLAGKTITVGHVVKMPFIGLVGPDPNLWYWPQAFDYVGGKWYMADPDTKYRVEVGSIFETIPSFNKTYGTGSFADGIHCVILAEGDSGVNTLVFKGADVFQLFKDSPTEIYLATTSNDTISEAIMGPVCDLFGIARGAACNSFWAEFSDPVFITNYVSILKTKKDILGNSRELSWFDHLALPFAILGTISPLPVSAFVSNSLKGLTRLGLKFSDAALGWMRTTIVQRPPLAIKPNFEPTPIGFFNAITQLTRAHAEEVLTAVSNNDFALAASKLNGYFLSDYGKAPIGDYKDIFQALRNGLNNDEAFRWVLEASGFSYPSISAVLNTLQKVTPSAGELSDVSKVMDDAGILGDVATTIYDTLKTLGTAADEMVGYVRNVLKNSPTVSTHVIAKHKTILDKIIAGTGDITKDETLAILNHGKVAPDGIHTMISSLDTTRLVPKLADGNYKQVLGNFIDLTNNQYDSVALLGKTEVDEWIAGNAKIAEDAIGSADPLKMSNLACDAQKASAGTGKIIDDTCGVR